MLIDIYKKIDEKNIVKMIDLCQELWYSISVKKIKLEFEHNSYKDIQKKF